MPADADITQLLQAWSSGDPDALGRLIPLVFDDLHRMACFYFQRESATHTLQPTALVNEVYLRMSGKKAVHWENRRQFFAFAAELMRHVLVDHARSRGALKRGKGTIHVPLDEMLNASLEPGVDLVALDDALGELAEADPRQCEVVKLRFFVGLKVEEIADVLEISQSTVKREWRAAKFWLHRALAVGKDKPAASEIAAGGR